MQLMKNRPHMSPARHIRQRATTLLATTLLLAPLIPYTPLSAAEPSQPPSLFVTPFHCETAELVGTGVAAAMRDLLEISLSAHDNIRLVERDMLERILAEHKLALATTANREQGLQVGRLVGAERLLATTLMPADEGVLAVLHLIDVKSATIVNSLKVTGKTADLPELTTRIAHDVAAALGSPANPTPPPRLERATLAATHFLRGLNSFHAGNHDHAIMEMAISDELNHGDPALHYWSGRAYEALEEPTHAAIEYERYLERAPQGAESNDTRQRLAACQKRLETK